MPLAQRNNITVPCKSLLKSVIRAENGLHTIVPAMQEPVAREARIRDDAIHLFALNFWCRTFSGGVRPHVHMDRRLREVIPSRSWGHKISVYESIHLSEKKNNV